jgi:dTDP-4-dehydrorhamnose reductase
MNQSMKQKKTVLIFGSNGMLGSFLANMMQTDSKDYQLIRNDKAEGGVDITQEDQVRDLIESSKPDVVINCAAYTDVNGAEDNPEIAYKVNADAPKYMAEICKKADTPFVHVSTDYVFGLNDIQGYKEDHQNFEPLNVYGASKLRGEQNINKIGGKNYIFRTSWLFGPNATNFIDKITKFARELPELKVVTDELGCPTYVKDLCERMLLAVEGVIKPDTYHVCSRDSLSRFDFAKEILSIQGIDTPIKECKLEDFERKAKVPNVSILINTKLDSARSAREMLEDYLGN